MAIAISIFFNDRILDTQLPFPTKLPLKRFSLDPLEGAGGGFYNPGISKAASTTLGSRRRRRRLLQAWNRGTPAASLIL